MWDRLGNCGASVAYERTIAGGCRRPDGQSAVTKPPHFAPKVKSIIYLFMAGAPSQLDLFDYKPQLKHHGQAIPEEIVKGERSPLSRARPNCWALRTIQQAWAAGTEVSELLPHLARVVDDIAVVRSVVTDAFNHAPAQLFVNTGSTQFGRPSMGSWVTYGLGSESQDLPGFVVLISGGGQPDGGTSCWGSGFLPTLYQGVQFRSQGDPVLFLSNPAGMSSATRRQSLDALNRLNELQLEEVGDPEIATRIAALRDGLPHAEQCARADGHFQRAGSHSRHVRHRAGPTVVRQQLPAGAAAGGTGRALCAALPSRLGQPRQQPQR